MLVSLHSTVRMLAFFKDFSTEIIFRVVACASSSHRLGLKGDSLIINYSRWLLIDHWPDPVLKPPRIWNCRFRIDSIPAFQLRLAASLSAFESSVVSPMPAPRDDGAFLSCY